MATMKSLKAKAAELKRVPKSSVPSYPSYIPSSPSRQVRNKLDAIESGRNSHGQEIQRALDFVLLNNSTFNLNSVTQLIPTGIEISEVAAEFETFVAELLKEGRIIKSPLFPDTYLQTRYENKFVRGEV